MDLAGLKKRARWSINHVTDKKWIYKLSNETLAEKIGVNKGTISNYRTMTNVPKIEFIDKFCSSFEFNIDWFLYGNGEPYPGARERYPEVCGTEGVETATSPDYKQSDYVFVPQVSDQIGAGGGFIPYSQVEIRIAFRKEWIEKRGDPKNMSLIRVSGDSMEPTLMSGDLVMVDHSRNYIDPQGGIYAIALDNTIMVKRLQVMYPEKRVQIISDNNKYKSIDADIDQIKINGKIIWFGRELVRSD